MLHMLIQNFTLGFVVTAIPGAVFVETIRRSLFHKSSLLTFLVGNFAGMFLIIASVLVGASSLFANKAYFSAFYALSGAVLVYIGLSSIRDAAKHKQIKLSAKREKKPYASIVTGFVLATANPISILFWVSMTGKMFQTSQSMVGVLLNSLSIVLGALTVFLLLIGIFGHARKRVKTQYFSLLSRGFGVLILGYGIVTLSKLL